MDPRDTFDAEFAQDLRDHVPPVAASPAFRAALFQRLVASHERLASSPVARGRRRTELGFALLAASAVLGGGVLGALSTIAHPRTVAAPEVARTEAPEDPTEPNEPTVAPTAPPSDPEPAEVAPVASSEPVVTAAFEPPPQKGELLEAPPGEPRAAKLGDGSEVLLDGGARVLVRGERDVQLLVGRLYIDVTPKETPFLADSAAGHATAISARLALDASEDALSVAVTHGTALLANPKGDTVKVAPGELAAVARGATPVVSASPRLSHVLAWAKELYGHDAATTHRTRPQRGLALHAVRGDGGEVPLEMHAANVDVVIQDGVARTAIDASFFNQEATQQEGVLQFPVPPGATVSRLAMYVNGQLVEGAVAERERARQTYEQIRYFVRRDPALLEWLSGNVFRLRVFPIEPRSEKRVIVSFVQELDGLYGTHRYVLPLDLGKGRVGRFAISVRVKGGAHQGAISCPTYALASHADGEDLVLSHDEADASPRRPLVLEVEDTGEAAASLATYAEGTTTFALARFRPSFKSAARTEAKPTERHFALLLDTSANRAPEDARAQREVVSRLLAELEESDRVRVATLDTTPHVLAQGWIKPDAKGCAAILAHLDGAHSLGALDLGAGLDDATAALAGVSGRHVIYVGNGLVGSGERSPRALAARLGSGVPFVSVAVGAKLDAGLLADVAAASGGVAATLSPGDPIPFRVLDVVSALRVPRTAGIVAEALDAEGRVVFGDLHVLNPCPAEGEEVRVLGRLDRAPDKIKIRGRRGDEEIELTASRATNHRTANYLPRLWAKDRVERLMRADPVRYRAEITELGKRHFLATPYTSLLVLESHEAYVAAGLQPARKDPFFPYSAPEKIDLVPAPAPPAGEGEDLVRYWGRDFAQSVVASTRTARHDGPETLARWSEARAAAHEGLDAIAGSEPGPGTALVGQASPASVPEAALEGDARALEPSAKSGAATPLAELAVRPDPTKLLGAEVLARLTDFLPGLAWQDADLAALEEKELGPEPSTPLRQDASALALIEKARSAFSVHEFTFESGTDHMKGVAAGDGRLLVERRLPTGVLEKIVVTHDQIFHAYPELGLGARRPLSRFHEDEVEALAPFLPPSKKFLARHEVVRKGESTVAVTAPGDALRLELDFGPDGKLREKRLVDRISGAVLVAIRIDLDGTVQIVSGDRVCETGFKIAAAPTVPARLVLDRDALVLLDVPARTPEVARYRLGATETVWKRLDRGHQLAFSQLVNGEPALPTLIAIPLRERKAGTWVLIAAAGGLTQKSVAEAIHARRHNSALFAWLDALAAPDPKSRIERLENVPAKWKDGFVTELALAMRAIDCFASGPEKRGEALEAARGYLARAPRGPFLLTVARAAAQGARKAEDVAPVASLYELAAVSPALAFTARTEEAAFLAETGDDAWAACALEQAYDSPGAGSSRLDAATRTVIARRGARPLGDRALDTLASGHGGLALVDVARSAALAKDGATAERALRRLPAGLPQATRDALSAVLPFVLEAIDEVSRFRLVDDLVRRPDLAEGCSELHARAASVAWKDGDLQRALVEIDRALAADPSPEAIHDDAELSRVRKWHLDALALHLEVAHLGWESDHGPELLRILDHWRALDPTNEGVYAPVARTLLRCEKDDERAWEVASTILALHPAEASSYVTVAGIFAGGGKPGRSRALLDEAQRHDQLTVELASPVHLLEEAKLWIQFNEKGLAREVLTRILAVRWGLEFQGVVAESANLLGGLEGKAIELTLPPPPPPPPPPPVDTPVQLEPNPPAGAGLQRTLRNEPHRDTPHVTPPIRLR